MLINTITNGPPIQILPGSFKIDQISLALTDSNMKGYIKTFFFSKSHNNPVDSDTGKAKNNIFANYMQEPEVYCKSLIEVLLQASNHVQKKSKVKKSKLNKNYSFVLTVKIGSRALLIIKNLFNLYCLSENKLYIYNR